jgi:PAS domain S-box-containing protein
MSHLPPPGPEPLLEALPLPAILFGPDGGLRVANTAFLAFTGIPAERLPPGLSGIEVARLLGYRGLLGPGDPEVLARAEATLDRATPSTRLIRAVDGRVIQIHAAPRAEGGFLALTADVTPLIVAQGEAASHARRLSEVVAMLGTGIATFGPDMRLAYANPAYAPLIGLPPLHPAEGLDMQAIIQMLDRRGEFAALAPGEALRLAERTRTGGPQNFHRRRPTGEVIETRATRLSDGGFLVEVSDVTARQHAEDEAKRRAALLASILDALPHGVCVYDGDRRVVLTNRAHAELIGPLGPATGERLENILRRNAAAGEFGDRDIEAVLAEEIAFRCGAAAERIRRRRDGRVLAHRVVPMPDGGHVSVVTDISALATAEAEAKGQAGLLRALIEGVPFGVRLYDRAGRLVAFNALGARMSGLQEGDLRLGMTVADVIDAEEARGEFRAAPGHYERIRDVDRGRPTHHRRSRPDGTELEIASLPMPDGGFLVSIRDVTGLVRAEQEAAARAGLLRAMVDNMAHGVVLYDAGHRLVAVNAQAARFIGVPAAELVPGTAYLELVRRQVELGEFEAGLDVPGLAARIPSGAPIRHRRTRPDGTVLDIAAMPMPDGGFVVTFTDVTRLVAAERDAARRADVLRGILDNITVGIFLYDAEGRLVACNAAALALTGLSAAEAAPGTRQVDLLRLLETRGELPEGLPIGDRIADAGGRPPMRYTRRRPDGTILDVSRAPMPDGGFVVTLADVTRLSRAEAEARSRAAIQAAMLDNMRHGIALFDAEHRLLASNPLAARLTGLPPATFHQGASVGSLRDAQIAAGEYTAEQAAARGHDGALRAPQRYVRERPDGSVVEVTTDRTPDGLFVRTFADVTEDRRVRADLDAARRGAEAALAAKSRFLATMTHELRTPLNAVIGFADLLQTPLPAPEQAEFAGMIAEAGRELLGLIDQILDVARSETAGVPVQTGRVELGPVLEQAAAAKRAAATAAGVAFSVVLPPDLPDAEADAARLGQVVQGLISNAIKFTPAGGRVALSACIGAEGGVAVLVSDTGIGISPDALPRVFEPFAQLDESRARRYAGSGIGLYLARSIADAMGMRLAIDSRQGEGTTVTLLIPPERCLPPDEESA